MTPATRKPVEASAVSPRLFWAVGGMAILLFWTTLNPWLSLYSLGPVARLVGWSGQPEINRPLSWLIFSLFRWLPPGWLPLALNLLTAGGAALALVQLARSVAILRYDVVAADPMRQKVVAATGFSGPWAWLPPVFAAVALGLQQGFWQHATSASGEMPSVLCFAFAFRCVLEYRRDAREKWLYRGALVYALGATDNWLMLGYAPLFGAAIIWAKGFGPCLEWRFFWRLAGSALLGLSLYLVVPLTVWGRDPDHADFWPTLLTYVTGQKNSLLTLRGHSFRLLALTGALPFLLLAVRWRSHSVQLADDTHTGIFITKATGHFIHALFFVTALWLTLNPLFTPRQTEINAALLVYHYAWALVAGYGIGYLLLFHQPRDRKRPARWPVIGAIAVLVAWPVLLIGKNFSEVRLTNSSALKEFAGQLYEDLPPGKIMALSDEPWLLPLLRAELADRDDRKAPLLIDTRRLAASDYRARLARQYGARWPEAATTNHAFLTPGQMAALATQLAAQEPLVYLHPSSGLFYEAFTGQPHGWVQYLTRRASVESPAPAAVAPEIQQLWQQRWTATLQNRSRQFAANRQQAARWATPMWKPLHLSSQANETATLLGGLYAKTLNQWGVQLRRAGSADAAQEWFERALALAPDNLAARINQADILRAQTGDSNRLTLDWARETFPDLIAQYQTWPEVISRNGPVDAPTFLLFSGALYLQSACLYQARECFTRSMTLAPGWPAPRLGTAQTLNVLGDFAAADALCLELLRQENSLRPRALGQLLPTRAAALWRLGQTNAALEFIETFTTRHQDVTPVVSAATDLYATLGVFPAELKWSERLTQRNPKQAEGWIKKGRAELHAENYVAAQSTLTRALELQPASTEARLFRAVAALQTGQLETARADYQELLKHPEQQRQALFGLGTVAWQQQDTNAILQYYQAFLSNNAAQSPQTIMATQRLKALQDE